MFPKNIHIEPKIKYINNKNQECFNFEDDDEFTIKINQIDDKIVYLVNSLFLEEEDESITFVSHVNLYKSILTYKKNKNLILQRNYNNLKEILKSKINSNKIIFHNNDNLFSFPIDDVINKKDIIDILNYFANNNVEIFNSFKDSSLKEKNVIDNKLFLELILKGLPSKIKLNNGLALKIKEISEDYLIKVNNNIYLDDGKEKDKIYEFINIPFIDIIFKYLDKNNKIPNLKYDIFYKNLLKKTIGRINSLYKPVDEIDYSFPEDIMKHLDNIENNSFIINCITEIIRLVGVSSSLMNIDKFKIKITKDVIKWFKEKRPEALYILKDLVKN